jgi:hypothetical protein
MKFRVESLYEIDAQPVVLATRLGTTEFSLARSAEPRLGGIRIRNFAEEVRRFRPDGTPDFDVFAFVLDNRRDKERFSVGQIVELEP